MSRTNVGFIGLGDQGAPMAEALIGAHSLYLWARRPETLQPFAGTEAHVMDTAQDVARRVEVLCLCLPGDEQLISLLFDQGLASELPHGATVINHATGDPKEAEAVAHRLADYDLNYLDAPVSGGRPGAIARTLTCFIGGDATTLAACEPVLSCYSNAVRLMGSPGAGQMTKLLNNALTVSNLRNVVEVFGLARQAGVDLAALQVALATSSGGSFIVQTVGKHVTPENAEHIAELNRKDVREFAEAMRRQELDPDTILDWAIAGADGLADLVELLAARSMACPAQRAPQPARNSLGQFHLHPGAPRPPRAGPEDCDGTSQMEHKQTMSSSDLHRTLIFGPFELLSSERVLRRAGVTLSLGSRAFDILVYLAERPGKVIGKKELIDHVWSDVTVEEVSLRVHVAAIRKALEDGQFGDRYIATVKGRGYSFIESVVVSKAARTEVISGDLGR
jgi:3-hydroxyisobutyrate dehydrogenase-like beta-hydroxyacid dehydrogenase/DNA-binding winged helix-turn-helix (wHTH) protein